MNPREVEAMLRADIAAVYSTGTDRLKKSMITAADTIAALRQKCAELEKNAERYKRLYEAAISQE